MGYRGYKQDEVVLRPVLREALSKRSFMASGKTCQLSEKALDNLISQVCSPALNEGLLKANERMYNHLLYGIAVTEFVDGKKVNPTIALIDWEHPENNQFHFTEEFTVLRSGGVETRRPDIVCFVNGIPLAVIEAKSPAGHGKKGQPLTKGYPRVSAISSTTKSRSCLPIASYYCRLTGMTGATAPVIHQ
jgi:type I site-specific restriction-modification system R (restriction) subunit